MTLHPYDGLERRFRDDDAAPADGLAIVARLLRLPAAPPGVRYDLSFYSGGMGIVDQLAIAISADVARAAAIARGLGFAIPDARADDLVWLVADEDAPAPLAEAVARFLDGERRAFQPPCRAGDPVWCKPESDVNHWTALWHRDGVLAFRGFDQG